MRSARARPPNPMRTNTRLFLTVSERLPHMMFDGTDASEENAETRPTWERGPPSTSVTKSGMRGDVAPPAILLGRNE